jgi:secreted trypsin-like serine protease
LNVNQIYKHEQYDPKTHENDIALIELVEPLPAGLAATLASSQIALITPAAESRLTPGQSKINVSGWGDTRDDGVRSSILRLVEVTLRSNDECNGPLSYSGRVKQMMFCAGEPEGQKDACHGDSGGPATVLVGAARVLDGLVSWGDGCGHAHKYGVYTRVAPFADWVDKKRCASSGLTCGN